MTTYTPTQFRETYGKELSRLLNGRLISKIEVIDNIVYVHDYDNWELEFDIIHNYSKWVVKSYIKHYYDTGELELHYWNKKHKKYEKDKPNKIGYYKSGQIQYKQWVDYENYYRENGPAVIKYYESGQIKKEVWYTLPGIKHRSGAPAVTKYYKSGQIKQKVWYRHGKEMKRKPYDYIPMIKAKR
jgi:hypothetical protein